jgi:hypothetical protein
MIALQKPQNPKTPVISKIVGKLEVYSINYCVISSLKKKYLISKLEVAISF